MRLRYRLKIKWAHVISNEKLCRQAGEIPMEIELKKNRYSKWIWQVLWQPDEQVP